MAQKLSSAGLRGPQQAKKSVSASADLVRFDGNQEIVKETGIDPSRALVAFGCVMLLFVCYTHRSNIERMRAGTENRAQRLWLLRKR